MKYSSCSKCKISSSCKHTALQEDSVQKDFLIISDRPSQFDDNAGTVMREGKDKLIQNLFAMAGDVDVESIAYSYAVKCYTPEVDIKKEAAKCLPYLIEEVQTIMPKCIMVCGEVSFKAICEGDYTKQIGTSVFSRKFGRQFEKVPIIVNYDTEFASEHSTKNTDFSRNVSQKFVDILSKAHNISESKEGSDSAVAKERLTKIVDVLDIDTAKKLVEYCKIKKVASFDFETPTLDYKSGEKPTSLAISFQAGSAYFIPMWHWSRVFPEEDKEILNGFLECDELTKQEFLHIAELVFRKSGVNKNADDLIEYINTVIIPQFLPKMETVELTYDIKEIIADLVDKEEWTEDFIYEVISIINDGIFGDRDIVKVAHNFSFDKHWGMENGIVKFRGRCNDTMLMHHLVRNDAKHGLKFIAPTYYPEFANWEESLGSYPWDAIPFKVQGLYNGIDTDLTLRIEPILEDELLKDEQVYRFYRNLTIPTMHALTDMSYRGMSIDRDLIEKSIKETDAIIADVQASLLQYPEVIKFEEHSREVAKKEKLKTLKEKIKVAKERTKVSVGKKIEKLQEKIAKSEGAIEDLKKNLLDVEEYVLFLERKKDEEDGDNAKELTREIKEEKKKVASLTRKHTTEVRKITNTKTSIAELETGDNDNHHVKNWKKQMSEIKTGVVDVYEGVSLSSPKQLGDLLYEPHGFGYPMQYDWKKRAKTKSTNKAILGQFEDDTGFIAELLKLKSIQHTKSTYLEGIRSRLDSNNMLHTSYNQLIDTGRISSRNPNLQNIPPEGRVKDAEASRVVGFIKKSFNVPEDCSILEADYSQAELKVAAEVAGETNMIEAYRDGQDLHVKTGCSIAEIEVPEYYELPKAEQKPIRQNAKAANFGLIFGQGAKGYQQYAKQNYGVEIDIHEATRQRDVYFETYPKILKYHTTAVKEAEKYGFMRTMLGYRRFLPDIHSVDDFLKGEAGRQAINTKIQGTAGQLTLFSICLLKIRLHPSVQMINTIHDSIFFIIPNHLLEDTKRIIRKTMENLPIREYFGVGIDSVKMKIDFKIGTKSWGEMEEIEE